MEASFEQLVNQVVWEPGNYHIQEIDESGPDMGNNTTRVNVAIRGLSASIEYSKNLCLAPRSPFTSFSLNPEKTWITLKTAEGAPTPGHGWVTFKKA